MATNRESFLAIVLVGSILSSAGCASYEASLVGETRFDSRRVFYVRKHEKSSRGIDAAVLHALVKVGADARRFAETTRIDAEAVVVDYVDHWKWDLAMYLESLDLTFTEAGSGKVLATAEYENSYFHTFPDPGDVAEELVRELFGQASPR